MRKHILVGLSVLFVLLGACSKTPPRIARENLTLGVALDSSRPKTSISAGIRQGVELAIAEYNADPTRTYDFKTQLADTKGTTAGAAAAAKSLVTDELLTGVVGLLSEGQVIGAAPVFEKSRVPFLVPSVSSMGIPKGSWRGFRRLSASDRAEGEGLARAMVARAFGGPAVLLHHSAARPSSVAAGIVEVLRESKIDIERKQRIIAVDIAPVTAAIAAKKPSVVFYAGPSSDAASLLTSMRAAGMTALFAASGEARNSTITAIEGSSGATTVCGCADPTSPKADAFERAYRDRFQGTPAPFSLEAYEGAWMVMEASEEVEPRARTISRFLRTARQFLGDSQLYRYDSTGELISPSVSIYEVREGSWVLQ